MTNYKDVVFYADAEDILKDKLERHASQLHFYGHFRASGMILDIIENEMDNEMEVFIDEIIDYTDIFGAPETKEELLNTINYLAERHIAENY